MTRSNASDRAGSKQFRMVFHTPIGVFKSCLFSSDDSQTPEDAKHIFLRGVEGWETALIVQGQDGGELHIPTDVLKRAVMRIEYKEGQANE